jgi:type I restriction enzyme S subunit
MTWASIPLPDCLIAHGVGRSNQINTADIRSAGRFPVVDQGQAYVAGYTNDAERVIQDGLPYVIFGDHTRCFKYVDFPFVLGADGTKVLKPNTELFDARFFYYAALALDIPSRGYNRHFTLLKEKLIPRPELNEQRQIATVLLNAQRAIERQDRLLTLTAELKKALMHKLFTEGTRGERQKQTEIGPVPENWEIIPLGSIAKIGNGSTPKRGNVAYWKGGTIPWLTSGKIHEGRITQPDQYVTETAKAECHLPLVAAGSLLVAITGEGKTLGNAALVEFDTCVSQHLAYVQFQRPDVLPSFLLHFLQRQYSHFRQISVGAGSTKKALTCGLLKRYEVPMAPKDEQKVIASALDAVDVKLKAHERAAGSLRSLFRTLLHQLMTAQIRVHDLDLSALDIFAEMHAYMVDGEGLDDAREAFYTREEGD